MARSTDPNPGKAAREERLAAKLRENLHRRKAQARSIGAAGGPAPENDSDALPNPAPES